MLVDATHPEETRVAIVESYRDHNRLEYLDFGLASKPILRGNIYLAKVMRIEPSLQAAFVEYGGNRHGFLPFSEIHPDYFRIPVADRSQEEIDAEDDSDADEETGVEGEDRTPKKSPKRKNISKTPKPLRKQMKLRNKPKKLPPRPPCRWRNNKRLKLHRRLL
jgi:ribonuclease E